MLSGLKAKSFPVRSETQQGCPFSLLLSNIMLEVSAKASRKEKGMKQMQIGGSEVTASLFIDVMVLCIWFYIHSSRELKQMAHTFSKVADKSPVHKN